MSKKKKQLYAGILALAAAMLLMDRALRGGSAQVAIAATVRSLEALGVTTSVRPSASVAAAPFPGSLPENDTTGGLRDIFVLNQRIRDRMLGLNTDDALNGDVSGRQAQKGLTPAATFQKEHRLNGTMVSDPVSFAIVDGAWFRVGDQLDNCQMTAITGTSVSWKCGDGVSTLSVVRYALCSTKIAAPLRRRTEYRGPVERMNDNGTLQETSRF